MLYITLIPVLILSFFMIRFLLEERKHDKILFSLCEIRRELIGFLSEKGFDLDKKEYFSIREFLESINNSIHYYNQAKLILFNFRSFLNFLRMYDSESVKAERVKISENPEIRALYKKFFSTFLSGFFAYTPFIRSEILFKLVIYTGKCLARYGRERANYYIGILINIEEQSTELGVKPHLVHAIK